MEGGTLTIAGNSSLTSNSVAGGTPPGYAGGCTGFALGSAVFLQGNGTFSFNPGAGASQTGSDAIADQTGSPRDPFGRPLVVGSYALVKNGAGTLTLSGPNSYTGVTTVNRGVLRVTGTLSPASASSV